MTAALVIWLALQLPLGMIVGKLLAFNEHPVPSSSRPTARDTDRRTERALQGRIAARPAVFLDHQHAEGLADG